MIQIEGGEQMRIARPILLGAGVLLATVTLLAAAALLTGAGTVQNPRPDPVSALASRDLVFSDGSDGSVEVHDARGGEVVAILPPETHGFVRGSLRALVRERNRRELGREYPFRVSAWPDGRLTLEDLATGTLVDLRAFGVDNAAAFASLLPLADP